MLVYWLELITLNVNINVGNNGHYDNIGSAYPWTGDIFPLSDVVVNLLF